MLILKIIGIKDGEGEIECKCFYILFMGFNLLLMFLDECMEEIVYGMCVIVFYLKDI